MWPCRTRGSNLSEFCATSKLIIYIYSLGTIATRKHFFIHQYFTELTTTIVGGHFHTMFSHKALYNDLSCVMAAERQQRPLCRQHCLISCYLHMQDLRAGRCVQLQTTFSFLPFGRIFFILSHSFLLLLLHYRLSSL